MHAGITDLSNNVLNSLRKACAAAAASTSSSSVLQDSGEGFPDLDSIYGGGGNGPTIQSIMEVGTYEIYCYCTLYPYIGLI